MNWLAKMQYRYGRKAPKNLMLVVAGGQIAAWLVNDRGERSRERFQFRDGLIWREWEDLTDEV